MHQKDDTKQKNLESYQAAWIGTQFNVGFYFGNVLLPFKERHLHIWSKKQ